MKNETQRAAITAIIDEIEQTQQTLGAEMFAHMRDPGDMDARLTVERIERRLRSIDINRQRPESDNWVKLGDAAASALEKLTNRKDGD
mgnify:CR=1 FL=1